MRSLFFSSSSCVRFIHVVLRCTNNFSSRPYNVFFFYFDLKRNTELKHLQWHVVAWQACSHTHTHERVRVRVPHTVSPTLKLHIPIWTLVRGQCEWSTQSIHLGDDQSVSFELYCICNRPGSPKNFCEKETSIKLDPIMMTNSFECRKYSQGMPSNIKIIDTSGIAVSHTTRALFFVHRFSFKLTICWMLERLTNWPKSLDDKLQESIVLPLFAQKCQHH